MEKINQLKATPATLPNMSQPQLLRSDGSCQTSRHVSLLDSQALLGAEGLVNIAHNGEIYLLRRTRLGKLILTK